MALWTHVLYFTIMPTLKDKGLLSVLLTSNIIWLQSTAVWAQGSLRSTQFTLLEKFSKSVLQTSCHDFKQHPQDFSWLKITQPAVLRGFNGCLALAPIWPVSTWHLPVKYIQTHRSSAWPLKGNRWTHPTMVSAPGRQAAAQRTAGILSLESCFWERRDY